jgi:hypothetical protein
MTSGVIQWEEDWFSVGDQAKEEPVEAEEQAKEQAKEEAEEEQAKVEVEEQAEVEAKVQPWKERMEALLHHMETLLHRQSERIDALEREIREIRVAKQTQVAPPSVTQLLEEWKQIKERELNYALRRRQPIPFFPLDSFVKWEQSVQPKSSSPLFRHQVMKERDREKEERGVEAMLKGVTL